jgi:hypothetical protein
VSWAEKQKKKKRDDLVEKGGDLCSRRKLQLQKTGEELA